MSFTELIYLTSLTDETGFVFQVGLEKMATEHTQLIYMTTGVLLQKLVLAKSLTEFTHIFLDEVCEQKKKYLHAFSP